MQAQERIPMPLDRAVMDFQTVGLVDTAEGQRLRVIVVVTEREGVDQAAEHSATRRPAAGGRRPLGVLGHPGSGPPSSQGRPSCTHSSVTWSTSRSPRWRVPVHPAGSQGLAMVLGRLAENRGIPFEEAHALVRDGAAVEPVNGRDIAVADLLQRVALELGSELRAAAEFYSTQYGSKSSAWVLWPVRSRRCPGLWRRCRWLPASSLSAARSLPRRPRPSAMWTPGSRRWPPAWQWGRSPHERRQPHPGRPP